MLRDMCLRFALAIVFTLLFLICFGIGAALAGSGGVKECHIQGNMAYVFTQDYLSETGYTPEQRRFPVHPSAPRKFKLQVESWREKAIVFWKEAIEELEASGQEVIPGKTAYMVRNKCLRDYGKNRGRPEEMSHFIRVQSEDMERPKAIKYQSYGIWNRIEGCMHNRGHYFQQCMDANQRDVVSQNDLIRLAQRCDTHVLERFFDCAELYPK